MVTFAVATGGLTSSHSSVRLALLPANWLVTRVRAHLHDVGLQVEPHADPVPHVTPVTVVLPVRACTPTSSSRLLPAFTVCEKERLLTFELPPLPFVPLSMVTCASSKAGVVRRENASAAANRHAQYPKAPPDRLDIGSAA